MSLPSGVSPWNSIFGPGRGSKYYTTTPAQNGPGSNDNEEILYVTQISKIGVSSSDGLKSYTRWGKSYPSAEIKSVYSLAPVD